MERGEAARTRVFGDSASALPCAVLCLLLDSALELIFGLLVAGTRGDWGCRLYSRAGTCS
jgi:hypothetical protein